MKTTNPRLAGDEARTRDVHLGKVTFSRCKCNTILATLLVLYFAGFGFLAAARPHQSKPMSDQAVWEQAVNRTLEAVMTVHEEHKGKLTWKELNTEVCKRMKVRRIEPWQK